MGVAPFHSGEQIRADCWYTVCDVATILGVTRPTVYRMIYDGRLYRVTTLLGPKIPGRALLDLIARQGQRHTEGK